jgi:hypothetical protein
MSVLEPLSQLTDQACPQERFVLPKTQVAMKEAIELTQLVGDIEFSVRRFEPIWRMQKALWDLYFRLALMQLTYIVPQSDFIKPNQNQIIVSKDISAKDWTASLHYSENDVDRLLADFLIEFKIDVNPNTKTWLWETVANIVSSYETQYKITLSKSQKKSLTNLALRMAYDRLRIE